MKKIYILIPLVVIIAAAGWAFWRAEYEAGYYGLPVVSCVDPTKPLLQDFSFTLQISINGKRMPLGDSIGHDPGKCLREIHTEDTSGRVSVQSTSGSQIYTLREFFNVWREQFTPDDFMGHKVGNGHSVTVYVNGTRVSTLADTPIGADDLIQIVYE